MLNNDTIFNHLFIVSGNTILEKKICSFVSWNIFCSVILWYGKLFSTLWHGIYFNIDCSVLLCHGI